MSPVPPAGDPAPCARARTPVALAGLAAALLAACHWVGGVGPARDAPPATAAPAIAAEVPAPLTFVSATLGRGTTLAARLAALDLASDLRASAVRALDGPLDLRRLSPATGIAIGADGAGRVRELCVRSEPSRFVRLRFTGAADPPAVDAVELQVETRVRTVAGRITSSVDQAIAHAPHGAQLTLAFAEVFQWDVDLLVEPRPGDLVRVVFETQEFGPLPEHLPPYDGRVGRTGDPVGLGRLLAASYEGALARSTALWVARPDGSGAYYDERGEPLQKTFLKSPLNYRRISSGFSRARRNPVTREVVPHHGVDFAAPAGTPVVAAADGRVATAGWDGPLGRAIRLGHGSAYATVYGHLSRFASGIRTGAEVRQGQVIGYVGSTGRATGPHLHYTLIEHGLAIDPMRFDNPPCEPLPPELEPRLETAKRSWLPLLAKASPDAGAAPG